LDVSVVDWWRFRYNPHMLTFIISSEPKTAADVATCGDVTARSSRSCAARKLARMLIDGGTPDQPIEARGVDGKLRYTVRSLVAFSKFTVRENPALGLMPWVPLSADTFSRVAVGGASGG